MEEMRKEIMVVGRATDADRGSWVVDITGTQFIRASAVRAFCLAEPGEVTKDGKWAIAAVLTPNSGDYVVVSAGLTEEEARRELVSKLS